MKKITTIICEDEESLCDGYKLFIDTAFSAFDCVAAVYDSISCIKQTEELKPDLLLLDIQLEYAKSGIEIIPEIKRLSPKTRIIMLTSHNEDSYLFQSIVKGANGYVAKQIDCALMFEEILTLYKKLDSTDVQLTPKQMSVFQKESQSLYENKRSFLYMVNDMVKLSASEYEILRDIYFGNTYKKIAEKRYVEECTIKSTASRIKNKLGFKTMKELIDILKKMEYFEQL